MIDADISYEDENSDEDEKNTEVTSLLSSEELGKMYSEFLFTYISLENKGYLYDVDNDGIEDLVIIGYSAYEYPLLTYHNGEVEKKYIRASDVDLTKEISASDLNTLLRERAAEYGYGFNRYFSKNSSLIGIVTTNGGVLNVRSGPSTSTSILNELPDRCIVNISSCYDTYLGRNVYEEEIGEDKSNIWYYVTGSINGSSFSGYVSGEYMRCVNTSI